MGEGVDHLTFEVGGGGGGGRIGLCKNVFFSLAIDTPFKC